MALSSAILRRILPSGADNVATLGNLLTNTLLASAGAGITGNVNIFGGALAVDGNISCDDIAALGLLLSDPNLGTPVALTNATPIDATTSPTVQLGRAYAGRLFQPVSIIFSALTKAGTLSTQPVCKIGNNAASDNITASSFLCSTAQFALAVPSQSRNTPTTPSVLVDLTTPLSLVVTTPGAGSGLALTCNAGVIGWLK